MASRKSNLWNGKRALKSDEAAILAAVMQNVFLFSNFIKLIHPLLGKIPFNLFPYQRAVLRDFVKHRFNVILKFRQAGITELIAMFCLWYAMYHPNKNIVIISIKDRVAKKVLRKIKFMYKNLPDFLKVRVVNGRATDIGTASEMEFSNGSIISSIPTTEEAGRGEAVSLMVIDEAAIVRWADRIWSASFPTLSTGGRAIINSCVTGDTEIIGQYGNFQIKDICPESFGVKNISKLGIKVLSHKGQWQKVTQGINKGLLETWELKNKYGNIIKCTPDHKFLTPQGWKSAKEIVESKSRVIIYKSGLDELQEPPITVCPHKEVFKPIPGFPNYEVSNFGKIYITKKGNKVEKKPNLNKLGYYRISLWNKQQRWKPQLHNIVAKVFMGDIPHGYTVDHINCNPLDNYVTNLQIITKSENTKRAALYSRGMKLGCKIGLGFPNLQLIALIRERYKVYKKGYGNLDLIITDCKKELNITVTRAFVSRIVNKERTNTVQISKLKLIRKYTDCIYDIQVENDHSYITTSNYVNHNTAYGIGNFFHKLFVTAISGGNDFNAIRLKWQMHPERDQNWYNQQLSILGPRKTAQEIDGDFLTSGNTVFDLGDIRDIEDYIGSISPLKVKENGHLMVFEEPKPHLNYTLGMDIATGRSNDFTAFSIMDQYGDEKVCFKGRVPIDKAEKLAATYGKRYNNALLAPESNDIGLGVATNLQNGGYPNLYYSRSLLRKKGQANPEVNEIPGWYTTKKNRPIIIAELEEDIRDNTINIKDRFFCDEAPTFIYNSQNKPVALNKDKNGDDFLDDEVYTDDAILAKAITNFVRKVPSKRVSLPE